MLSLDAPRPLAWTARALGFLAAAAPFTAPAQLAPSPQDAAPQLIDQIEAQQLRDGPYSPALIDSWTALAQVFEEQGQHGAAVTAIEQAHQVVKANHGLFSLEQVPLMEQWLRNAEAAGDAETAWKLQQELLALAERHPNDLRTAAILRQVGDKRMSLLRRYLAGERPAEITLGCYYMGGPQVLNGPQLLAPHTGCSSGSRGMLIHSLLTDAWSQYYRAIGVLIRHEMYTSDALREMELELVRTSYRHKYYEVGRQSLRRLLAYDVAREEPFLTRIDWVVQMADWDLLAAIDRKSGKAAIETSALDTYRQAYALLAENGVEQATIDAIFSPAIPVMLPAFLPNPLAPPRTQRSTGHVDLAFEITKYGRSRRVAVRGATANVADDTKDEIVREISRGKFRPRMTDGALADASPVVVRYYLVE